MQGAKQTIAKNNLTQTGRIRHIWGNSNKDNKESVTVLFAYADFEQEIMKSRCCLLNLLFWVGLSRGQLRLMLETWNWMRFVAMWKVYSHPLKLRCSYYLSHLNAEEGKGILLYFT